MTGSAAREPGEADTSKESGTAAGIVILAAGASTRMGRPKQLLPYGRDSFLSHTVAVALASGCCPIVVVLGAYAEQVHSEVSQLPVRVVKNVQWAQGMSTSIRTGIEALSTEPDLEAAVLMLCDQPFVSVQVINQLIRAYQVTGKSIVASEYAGTLGVPVLFKQTLFSELMALSSREGAKQIIRKYTHQAIGVPFSDGAIDIDTPKDYEHLLLRTQ